MALEETSSLDYGAPTGRLSLGAGDGAQVQFAPFLQDLKQNLHLSLIGNSMQQKVVQDVICSLYERR